jgi:hypothetical protein
MAWNSLKNRLDQMPLVLVGGMLPSTLDGSYWATPNLWD